MGDFEKAAGKQQIWLTPKGSSTSSTDGAIFGASSANMVQPSAATTAPWKLKQRDCDFLNRDIVDLTADSPHSGGIRSRVPSDSQSPELSFLRRRHRTNHRHRETCEPERNHLQVPAEAEILVMDSEARQTVNPKKGCSGLRAPSVTRDKAPLNRDKADRQKGPSDVLEEGVTSFAPSGGSDHLRPVAPLDAIDKKKKASVSSGVESDVGGSREPEPQLRWKRKRSSITDTGTSSRRFKPPRQVRVCNRNGMSFGDVERPIEIDSLEPSSTNAAAENNAMVSLNRARQIEEDELLAKFLQEDYGLEAEGGSLILDDAHLARMLQEEENAKYTQRRVESVPRAVNASTLRAATNREIQRVLPTIRSQAARPAASSSRMRILRNLHNRSHPHIMRGHRLGGPASSSQEQLLHFPEGLDLESRLEYLAAMETVSQGSFTMLNQVGRDFNEGDYEILLALDDRNHGHSGASHNRIEQLPISVIKPTDVYQETCSICLEIPVVDDLVRRLPCMHGFHLQCIDEWLVRQANCPICKMEI